MTDRGAKALDERLIDVWHDPALANLEWPSAEVLLRSTGLFIADVTKHEPRTNRDAELVCSCGWDETAQDYESYFDHLAS
jgi:hypothetical protein